MHNYVCTYTYMYVYIRICVCVHSRRQRIFGVPYNLAQEGLARVSITARTVSAEAILENAKQPNR